MDNLPQKAEIPEASRTRHPLVIITGPTAVGKTDLSLDLARYFRVPIISADSRQCYRYMDIGTAKVSEAVQKEIRHYHISTLNPDQPFSAADFAQRVSKWSDEINKTGHPVLIVGGSTMYIESLVRPMATLPPRSQRNMRRLEQLEKQRGLDHIIRLLQRIDPGYLKRIDGPNRQRIFRALDVWIQTGRPFSSFHEHRPLAPPKNMLFLCLVRERASLHQRIAQRVDQMIRDGLLEEVTDILKRGYSPELQSLKTVGYREAIRHLNGDLNVAEMTEKIKTSTRRYARRQLTWFRRYSGITTISLESQSSSALTKKIIDRIEPLAAQI